MQPVAIDFETYSEAGHIWNESARKWKALPNASRGLKGLEVVGAARYAEHPSTEVLTLSYWIGGSLRRWRPGLLPPIELFAHIRAGGLVQGWNTAFEHWIWNTVCVKRYGWPPLPQRQLRCTMARARAHALPGKLEDALAVMGMPDQKDADGKRLLDKFSKPRNPTKADPRQRIRPGDDPEDAERLYTYCDRDVIGESGAARQLPELTGLELEFWLADQAINSRGVAVDVQGVEDCIALVEQAHARYNAELLALTGIDAASKVQQLQGWLHARGVHLDSLDEEHVGDALKLEWLPPDVRRVLQIRAEIGSAAVKKLFAIRNQVCADGRLHDLFSYHAARTGRATGNGPQPTNLPNSGPMVVRCGACGKHSAAPAAPACPWCGVPFPPGLRSDEWNAEAAADVLGLARTRSLDAIEHVFGSAMPAVAGCLRGLFVSAPSKDLICSDYSSIEAVVLAEMAGCEWRRDVFRTHGKIYEVSAAKITGRSLEEYAEYKARAGSHHPDRKLGKVAELASGYQGWIGAWQAFGADEFMTEEEIKTAILAWRAASPEIPELWGGQPSWRRAEYYGIEGCAVQAVLNPGTAHTYRMFTWQMQGDVLYCSLPSGRRLTYHRPRLEPSERDPAQWALSYEGWNTNPKNGGMGWIRIRTWGGRLVENLCQATARDILAHAIVNLERKGYPVVLHVYDEICSEVPEGFGSVEEFESTMMDLPAWAAGWPIKAAGGWRSRRYKKA